MKKPIILSVCALVIIAILVLQYRAYRRGLKDGGAQRYTAPPWYDEIAYHAGYAKGLGAVAPANATTLVDLNVSNVAVGNDQRQSL